MQFSKWLAIVGGVLAPALETIRRWSTWKESPANLFDDYIMGGLLLYGAWRVGKDRSVLHGCRTQTHYSHGIR